MGRLDQLPQNQFADIIARMRADLRDIKNKQRQSGKGGMTGYFAQSADTWDYTATLNTGDPSFGSFAEFEIIFTGSGRQSWPIENIYLDFFVDGTTDANRPDPGTGIYNGASGDIVVDGSPELDKSYSDEEFTYRWTFSFSYYGLTTVYMKAYVAGSSNGTIEINRTF